MRIFSTLAKHAMNDQHNKGQVWLYLCEISSPIFPTQRFVDNNEDIVSGGNTYQKRTFTFQPPAESEDNSDPTGTLRLDNVDLTLGKLLVLMQRDAEITVSISKIIAAEPDTLLWTQTYALRQLQCDDQAVELTLGAEDALSEGLPWLVYSLGANEGLFELGQYIAGTNFGGAPVNVDFAHGEEPPGG